MTLGERGHTHPPLSTTPHISVFGFISIVIRWRRAVRSERADTIGSSTGAILNLIG